MVCFLLSIWWRFRGKKVGGERWKSRGGTDCALSCAPTFSVPPAPPPVCSLTQCLKQHHRPCPPHSAVVHLSWRRNPPAAMAKTATGKLESQRLSHEGTHRSHPPNGRSIASPWELEAAWYCPPCACYTAPLGNDAASTVFGRRRIETSHSLILSSVWRVGSSTRPPALEAASLWTRPPLHPPYT